VSSSTLRLASACGCPAMSTLSAHMGKKLHRFGVLPVFGRRAGGRRHVLRRAQRHLLVPGDERSRRELARLRGVVNCRRRRCRCRGAGACWRPCLLLAPQPAGLLDLDGAVHLANYVMRSHLNP